jgi:hypothetical protein
VWPVTNGARIYDITIRGAASELVQLEFEDVQLRVVGELTYLRTGLVDQTILFGLIRRIEDLGLVLLQVGSIQADASEVSLVTEAPIHNRSPQGKGSHENGQDR